MTTHKDWPELFAEAARWPDLRLYCWKDFKHLHRRGNTTALFTKFLRDRSQPGAMRTIYLTDDLLWAVTKLSVELDPLFLTEQVKVCRMPFDNVVFEWSGPAKQAFSKELCLPVANADKPHKATDHPAILVRSWGTSKELVHITYEEDSRRLTFFPLYTLVGDIWNITGDKDLSFVHLDPKAEADKSLVAHYLFSSPVVAKHPDCVTVGDDNNIVVVANGPLAAARLKVKQPLLYLMAGTAGEFRCFGALCALLNRQAMVRYVDAPPPDPGPAGPSKPRQPTDRPQTAVLMLPRERVIRRVVSACERERKKPGRHEVMGFWSYRRKSGNPNCVHVWPNQPTHRQVCEVCGAVRWWKDAFQRGTGDVLKTKQRRAAFTGVSVDRLVETMKQGH